MNVLDIHFTIKEFMLDRPSRFRVLHRLGIDYSGTGLEKSLVNACAVKGLDPRQVVDTLLACQQPPWSGEHVDWFKTSLSDLIDHIQATHHAYLSREMPWLMSCFPKRLTWMRYSTDAGMTKTNHPSNDGDVVVSGDQTRSKASGGNLWSSSWESSTFRGVG